MSESGAPEYTYTDRSRILQLDLFHRRVRRGPMPPRYDSKARSELQLTLRLPEPHGRPRCRRITE